jgi:hypothetical protein
VTRKDIEKQNRFHCLGLDEANAARVAPHMTNCFAGVKVGRDAGPPRIGGRWQALGNVNGAKRQ